MYRIGEIYRIKYEIDVERGEMTKQSGERMKVLNKICFAYPYYKYGIRILLKVNVHF